MKILKTIQVKEADCFTIENEPISSIDLMERAATNAYRWIKSKFLYEQNFVIFAGPGNNGGDGLVIARKLKEIGKNVLIYIVEFSNNFSEDFKTNYERLNKGEIEIKHIKTIEDFPNLFEHFIVIDAIFGSGLTRQITGFAGEVIEKINNIIDKTIIAIDIPSGLFGEQNYLLKPQIIIKADFTLSFEFPFLSFMFPENQDYVGTLELIPIGISKEFIKNAETDYYLIEYSEVTSKIYKRPKYSHKGNYGHGLLVAGTYGKMGAAVLAAKAAHRSGIGLLTAHVAKKNVNIMQISSSETMLSIDENKKISTKIKNLEKYNAIGIGPAIGFDKKTVKLLKKLFISQKQKPFVIDADAITILSENKDLLKILPKNSILTPHPKEFSRLIGETKNDFERLNIQREFSKKFKTTIILKGANSSISTPEGKVYFNPTGNPGMATGGSGDVLTGILLGLLAQGYIAEDAAIIGTFFHGLAADTAVEEIGQNALIASDIIDYLGYVLNF